MKDAIAWIKEGLSTKSIMPAHRFYLVKDGMIYATDGRMTCGHPFPYDKTFCAGGAELDKLVSRMSGAISIELGEDDVTVKAGRLRGKIKTIDPKDWPYETVNEERSPVPPDLMKGLRLLRPFISDNATRPWALCVRAVNDTLYATNNVTAAAIPGIELDDIDVLIPNWAIDFVLAREGVTHWSHDKAHVGFHWSNGAWMSTRLIDGTGFPETIEDVINKAGYATHKLTDDWKDAFNEITSLIDGQIVLREDKMVGRSKSEAMDVEVEAFSVVPKDGESGWSVEYLSSVVACASHFNPDTYPAPSPFRGDGIIGVIIGRRITT